jgi:subtilisin-like proprotein convertase family protein
MSDSVSNAQNTVPGFEVTTTTSAHISTFSGRGGSIPDGRGNFMDDIIVKDDFKVTDVTVTLYNLNHTWSGDLTVQLYHLETRTIVDLFRRPGQPQFSSSGYSSDLKGDYSFNDHNTCDFVVAAERNSVIPGGNYTPASPLKAFYGLSAGGTWRLIINDSIPGDSGSLGSWKLDLGWG